MDDTGVRTLAHVLKKELKKYYHERNVYLIVLGQLKSLGVPDIDDIVSQTLQDQDLLEASDQDFAFLDEWLPPISEVELQTAQKKWLENWKPTQGKPH